MISARNYAAHVQKEANNKTGSATGVLKTIVAHLSSLIPRSQKFAIPDGGKILNTGLKGLIGAQLKLPYEIITVECFCDGTKYCVLAEQKGEDPIAIIASGCATGDNWVIQPMVLLVQGVYEDGIHAKIIDDNGADEIPYYMKFLAQTVLELCEALSCINVSHAPIEKINPAVNDRRIKAGKLPLYETHQLVIDAGRTSESRATLSVGSHASPRQHFRRGHIRRLENKNIWVNSCVVGDRNNGVIAKDYAVRKYS